MIVILIFAMSPRLTCELFLVKNYSGADGGHHREIGAVRAERVRDALAIARVGPRHGARSTLTLLTLGPLTAIDK
jgi:hypothetical protein